MRIHLDANSGIAGDMFMAACLDLGLDQAELVSALKTIDLPDWSLEVKRELRGGIGGLHVDVIYPAEKKHRHLPNILALINNSGLPTPVKERACAMFVMLGDAEGKVHGVAPEKVHFHEVGAVDSIVDICAAAFAAWRLGFTEVTSSPVPVGSGTITCDHGQMPVPVPAVSELFNRYNIPIKPDSIEKELVTPTGAAILASLVDRFTASPLTRIDHIGYGLGRRNLADRANALRILAQKDDNASVSNDVDATDAELQHERIGVLSTHIDDMNPEWYGLLWERLFAEGALDMALIPMTMKKGRPGIRLEVIVPPGKEKAMAKLVLTHTTALGVRFEQMDRLILRRNQSTFETPWGPVQTKNAQGINRIEYEDLAKIAREQEWPLPKAHQMVLPFLTKNDA